MNDVGMLAEQVGVSERTLRRAVNQGTLKARRSGPRTSSMSLAERTYIRRCWPLIAALRAALRTESNVRFALLYGSVARGSDTAAGDVDVLLDLRDPSLERLLDVQAKLAAAAGRPVDVVRLSSAEREPSFLADALADGRVLVDRAGLWPTLLRREARLRRRGEELDTQRARGALAGIDRLLAARPERA